MLPDCANFVRPRGAPARPGWRLALFLSFVAHGLVLTPLVWFAGHGSGSEVRTEFVLDTRVHDREMEVGLVLCLPEPRPQPPPPVPSAKPPEPVTSASPPPTAVSATPPSTADDAGSVAAAPRVPGYSRPGVAGGVEAQRSDSGTGLATPAFFPVPAGARSVVYVIDRSASMGQFGFLAAAKRELLASLDRLPAAARFQVIVYNKSAAPLLTGGLVAASAENKGAVARLLQPLRAEGATDHLGALRQALLLQPDVIFFLTDAGDLRAADVRDLTRRNHGLVSIHAVELAAYRPAGAELPLQALARANHGTYRAVVPSP